MVEDRYPFAGEPLHEQQPAGGAGTTDPADPRCNSLLVTMEFVANPITEGNGEGLVVFDKPGKDGVPAGNEHFGQSRMEFRMPRSKAALFANGSPSLPVQLHHLSEEQARLLRILGHFETQALTIDFPKHLSRLAPVFMREAIQVGFKSSHHVKEMTNAWAMLKNAAFAVRQEITQDQQRRILAQLRQQEFVKAKLRRV
jgi:hypothetical protein